MKFSKGFFVGASIAAFTVIQSSALQAEEKLKWEKWFTSDGAVEAGFLTRDWIDVNNPVENDVRWEVKDGILVGTGVHSTDENWIGSYLLTEKRYSNFVLEAEFKFKNGTGKGNGGIAVRTPLHGDPAYQGMEFQITDTDFEFSYFPGAGADELTGSIYLLQAPKALVYKPGEWNKYRIDMRGSKVKAWLNGTLIHNIDLNDFLSPARRHGKENEPQYVEALPGIQRPRTGHIGFQDLSDPGEALMFRNVRIAPLD